MDSGVERSEYAHGPWQGLHVKIITFLFRILKFVYKVGIYYNIVVIILRYFFFYWGWGKHCQSIKPILLFVHFINTKMRIIQYTRAYYLKWGIDFFKKFKTILVINWTVCSCLHILQLFRRRKKLDHFRFRYRHFRKFNILLGFG